MAPSAAAELKRKLAELAARDSVLVSKTEMVHRLAVPIGVLDRTGHTSKYLHRFGGKGAPAAQWTVAPHLDRWGQEKRHDIRSGYMLLPQSLHAA